MRSFGWTAVALAVAMLAGMPPAAAQFMRDHDAEGGVRGFHGSRSIGKVTRSFQSDAEARAELERILSAVGLGYVTDRITLRATAQTPNAEAFVGKDGERFIFYNAAFMQRVKQRTAEHWSLVSILAHEVGHHVAFHTVIEGHDHKFELEADYFSGFVLKRLGATLDQTDAAMRLISPKTPGPTHPGLDDRLTAITLGWTDGGAAGAPPGLKAAKEAAAGPQNVTADAVLICREVEGMSSLSMLGVLANQHKGTLVGDCIAARLDELEQADAATRKADEAAQAKERERVALLQKRQEEEKEQADAKRKADEEAAWRHPALSVKPGSGESFRDCDVCPEMVVVPAGSFTMGSSPAEIAAVNKEAGGNYHSNEGPQRTVNIARPFAVGKFEVTFAEWNACVAGGGCAYRPDDHGWGRGERPVIHVSWNDITKEYLPWLSGKTGKTYRLLTEAEWEYAARAGTTTRYAFGNTISTSQAHYNADKTVDVGSFRPNAFGIYDMHGNVWEWVQDCYYSGNYDEAPSDGSAWTAGDCSSRVLRAPGSSIRGSSARRSATGTPPSTGASASVSVLGGCLPPDSLPLYLQGPGGEAPNPRRVRPLVL